MILFVFVKNNLYFLPGCPFCYTFLNLNLLKEKTKLFYFYYLLDTCSRILKVDVGVGGGWGEVWWLNIAPDFYTLTQGILLQIGSLSPSPFISSDPGHRDIWYTGHRDIRDTGHRDIKDTGHRDIWYTGHRDIWYTGHRDIWDTRHWDITDMGHRDIIDTVHWYIKDTGHRNIKDTGHWYIRDTKQ